MAENRGGEIIGSFVVGGLIGAVIGMLFAPMAGKESREKLVDWMDETREKTKDTLDKLETEIKHRKEQLLKHVN
ncbi:MAG: hypothetical protein COT18_01535 [Elusimicrobia bacterium CG08_land_8_20_14_0_20_59_10]|nr:MAG: hypothetical protein COT18_01535 [Elusimicrobia bacterium CG08_land_8_20_14_0_20_59_10]